MLVTLLHSKLSSKGQVTLPFEVRKALGLKAGDDVVYELAKDQIRIRKGRPLDLDFLRSQEGQLTEWKDGLLDDGL